MRGDRWTPPVYMHFEWPEGPREYAVYCDRQPALLFTLVCPLKTNTVGGRGAEQYGPTVTTVVVVQEGVIASRAMERR